jgi:hypothetical protein
MVRRHKPAPAEHEDGASPMRPALKAALERLRALLLAAAAGSAAPLAAHAQAPAAEAAPVSGDEERAWAEAQARDTSAAYERYLELYPIGRYVEEAFRLLVERSLRGRPVMRLVDIEPAAGPGGVTERRTLETAALALY